MLQVHTCVSVHCEHCGDALGGPLFQAHYRTGKAALDAAATEGWRADPGRGLLCSACVPVLTCDAEGHNFSTWRHPLTVNGRPALSEYRHCWRCCRHESRPATPGNHDGGELR
ncbi:MAG: hypothetical protein ACRDRX_23560 [Pseudonocardiaceae bacterium]